MMTIDTRRRIDSARDILVGKVPDPKAQVEQITMALIYKFMDDMDKESEELGGKAQFFVNEYEKYSWSKLLDPRLGGFDRLNLYSEALQKMPQNPNLPQLFRNILKDAFLPYRDPETLNLFLKEINEFTYDHSEKLGDAFEYLLSVLGSQGDAGQFRTPRHIIDFIVEVVDPNKDETILDPACGTAGFLISGYKHILKQNTIHRSGDQLTPEEKTKLMEHFVGYDISPDMVKLSLVNMYLHSFPNPNVFEYDTLTSEERWDETYDVIMANPPFMTPKGGIRPHKRFSIQANRSEVLFVDYIAEHLTTHGRAGVIVPEGIIFQSGNAYKALRKMLVEKYLFAVVSLPGGVFQPYSGVKTSILLMDKQLAKKAGSILFVKVENDGFDLGAQRRVIEKNDLTKALYILQKYKQALNENANIQGMFLDEGESKLALVVEKAKIAKNGDYNLTGERYRETLVHTNIKWPLVELGEICDLVGGGTPSKENKSFWENGTIKWVSAKHINDIYLYDSDQKITEDAVKSSSTNVVPENTIIIVTRVSVGKMTITQDRFAINQDLTGLLIKDPNQVNTLYLFRVLKSLTYQIEQAGQGLGVKGVTRDYVKKIVIPLPPLEVQKEIIAELDIYQKIIDGAKLITANWKPVIEIDPEWEKVRLSEVCEITSSKRIFQEEYVPSGVPFYRTKEIVELNHGKEISLELFISEKRFEEIKSKFGAPQKKDILISAVGTIGVSWIVSDERQFYFKDGNLLWLREFKNVDAQFIKYILDINIVNNLHLLTNGAAYNALTIVKLKELLIPLPPLDIQERIVSLIEEEQKRVQATKELVEIFEQKIKDKIAEVWGTDITPNDDNNASSNSTFKQAKRVQQAEPEQAELGLG